jgi:hypothetical protein
MGLGFVVLGLSLPASEAGAQVEPVDFQGTSTGVFVNPQPASASVSGVGTNSFAWGTGGSSSLSFSGAGFAGAFKHVFSLGTLSYSNGTTFGGEASSVDLQVTITLTTPSGVSQPVSQTLSLINTTNVEGDPEASADLVFLPASFPKVTFELEGVRYTLNFIAFGTVTGQGFVSAINSFHVFEGGQASANLLGSITQACVTTEAAPIREQIAGFGNCGASSEGPLSPYWGRFGRKDFLEADSGDRLELRCDDIFFVGSAYQLFLTPSGGSELRVGLCPWDGGCNTAEFYHSGDQNKNGKPDCFVKTLWNSADYHHNDKPNPWTESLDISENALDWAVSIYDFNSAHLTKKDYKWEYAIGPPVPFENCGNQAAPIPEGGLIESSMVDPPLGPETEAFFDEVLQRFAQLPPSGVPMGLSLVKACDFDGDGDCDASDLGAFNLSLGRCEKGTGFDPRADVDRSGCVDALDRRYLFELDEDADGVTDAADNCPTVRNPGQEDGDGDSIGDACESRVTGDLDYDADVDRNDVNIVLASRNTPATGPDDARDLDGDGRITTLDARKLTRLCTRPRCAVN